MKARILTIFLGVALVGAGYFWGNHSAPVVHAAEMKHSIPKAWGKVVGVEVGLIVLEDSQGTIRFVGTTNGTGVVEMTRN